MKDGGAIKWIYREPQIMNVFFLENDALYGKNIASVPIRMKITIFDQKNNIYYNSTKSTFPELENCVSGSILRYKIQIEFMDLNNIIVSTLPEFEFEFKIIFKYFLKRTFLSFINEEQMKKLNISGINFTYTKFIVGKKSSKINQGNFKILINFTLM